MTGALLAALAVLSCGAEHPDYKRPDSDVIFISIDTLRADHLGCYGYPRDTSPELNEFTRDAVLFRKAIADLRRQLAQELAATATTGRQEVELDEETKARLKALGYIR